MNFHQINFEEDNYIFNLELVKANGDYITSIPREFVENVDLRFNEVSSIDLYIPKYKVNPLTKQKQEYKYYEEFSDERIINLNEDYSFIIKSVDEQESQEKGCWKKIKAKSLDYLLEKTDCILKEQTWQLRKDSVSTAIGIMDSFTEQTMGTWTWDVTSSAYEENIGNGISNKYRYLGLQSNWNVAFRDTLPSAFRCLFITDSYNRKVHALTEQDIDNNSNVELFLETGNYIKSVNVKNSKEQYCNRLYVTSDKCSLSTVNIYGDNYIELYDEHCRSKMSDELKDSLNRYDKVVSDNNILFLTKKGQMLDLNKQIQTVNETIISLREQFNKLNSKRTEYLRNDSANLNATTIQLQQVEQDMANQVSQLNSLNNQLNSITNEMAVIGKQLNKVTSSDSQGLIFNTSLLSELMLLTSTGQYQDNTSLTDDSLLINSKKELEDRVKIVQEFEIDDMVAFIASAKRKDMKQWNKVLKMGQKIAINTKTFSGDVRIVGMSYTPTSTVSARLSKMKLILSNKPYVWIDKSRTSGMGRQQNSVNSVFNNSRKWTSFEVGANYSEKVRNEGLDLAVSQVQGRYQNSTKIIIDSSGILILDSATEQKGLFISNGLIALSDDGFKTARLAISGDGGISAQEIAGKLILGEKLIITTPNNDFIIGDVQGDINKRFGIQLYDQGVERIFIGTELINGTRKSIIRLIGKNGQLAISEDGLLNTNQMSGIDDLDSTHPMILDYYVDSGVSRIDKAILKLRCRRFRSTTRGGKLVSKAGIIASGGTVSTSGSSNSTTSSSEGNHRHKILKLQSTTDQFMGDRAFPFTFANNLDGDPYTQPLLIPMGEGIVNPTDIFSYGSSGSHQHQNPHDHNVDTRHSHPDIDISHQHIEDFGVFEDTVASNIVVSIGGTTVITGGNGDFELDITQYLVLGQWNEIKIESFTNGRVSWNLFTKSFNMF